jgi:hypothetical protein
MAHRDDVEALRARIEAQERDLRDAKAELDELLAAARANAASAPDSVDPPMGAMGFGPTSAGRFGIDMGGSEPDGDDRSASAAAGLRAETQRRVGLLVLLITTLVAGLFVSTANCPHRWDGARSRRSRTTAIAPVPSAMPTSAGLAAGASGRFDPFVRFARVIDAGVPAAVPLDQMCAIEVTPVNGSAFDCRVVVRCDDHVLYGETPETGFNQCGAVPSRIFDGNVTRLDGDPAIEIDFASGSVVIEERVGLGTQRVELMLER